MKSLCINKFCLILFISILLFSNSTCNNILSHKPIFVYETFREAYRPPSNLSVNDTDLLNISWANSNDITSKGINSHFTIGASLRHHYISKLNFISDTFTPREFILKSKPTNQNIFTLYSHLLGMYSPPFGSQIKFVKGAIPPIDTTITDDVFKDLDSSAIKNNAAVFPIELYTDEDKGTYDVLSSCDVKEDNKEIAETLSRFKENYSKKLNIKEESEWDDIVDLCETVYFDDIDNKLYQISTKVDIDILKSDCQNVNYINVYNRILKDDNTVLYATSNLLREIVNRMDNAISGKRNKYFINSSSDIDLAAMIKFIFTYIKEDKSSSYIYPSNDKSLLIELSYNDINTKKMLINIFIGNEVIVSNMSYDDFKVKIFTKIYSQSKVSSHCKIGVSGDKNELIYIVASVVVFLCGVGLTFAIYKQVKGIRERRNNDAMNENNSRDELWKENENDMLILED